MTKQEKLALLFVPVMFLLLAIKLPPSSAGWFKTGSDLYFAIWFPALMYVLYFWGNRGFTARWIEFPTENTIRSRKPMLLRTYVGMWAVALGLFAAFVLRGMSWPLPSDQLLGFFCTILLIGGPAVFLFFFAGPQEVLFDLHRGEWQRTWGFPLVRWTSHGQTNGGTLILSVSGGRGSYYHNLQFKPPIGRAITIGMYGNYDAARADAERICELLHIPVNDIRR
jgi:hypothetical protein